MSKTWFRCELCARLANVIFAIRILKGGCLAELDSASLFGPMLYLSDSYRTGLCL